jgi:3-keto-5-aminohexanoate cleavage enzyme
MLNDRINVAEYAKLTRNFSAEKFDAKQWAQAAQNAGMKYMVLTARHHDGFCLFDSKASNSFDDIRYSAKAVYDRRILPETEVFEIGMLHNMELVQREQPFAEPVLYNLVFGHPGIMQATPETLAAFCSFVPKTVLWGVTHYGRDNWTFLAAAIAAGATVVRVGFEDSGWLSETETAQFNWQVVERLVRLIRAMGLEPATPQEAREILHLKKR